MSLLVRYITSHTLEPVAVLRPERPPLTKKLIILTMSYPISIDSFADAASLKEREERK